jgi:hypothetical protein
MVTMFGETFSCNLTSEQKQWIERRARDEARTMAEVVRSLIQDKIIDARERGKNAYEKHNSGN